MTNTLRKAIMKRSKLRNKFIEERNIENRSEYKRQHNSFRSTKAVQKASF